MKAGLCQHKQGFTDLRIAIGFSLRAVIASRFQFLMNAVQGGCQRERILRFRFVAFAREEPGFVTDLVQNEFDDLFAYSRKLRLA
jgi:hypothetical protein